MSKLEKIEFLIDELIKERDEFKEIKIPKNYEDKRKILRSLMNVREPGEISKEFLKVQDEFLKEERNEKGVVKLSELPTINEMFLGSKNRYKDRIILWKGDITRLEVDAIVNAANNQMLGCFIPCHRCIDNTIHSSAGIQLREECYKFMKRQGYLEKTGEAKITEGYNLPSKYILHTVGPIVTGDLTDKLCRDLQSCYQSCLELAEKNKLESIAFCCISTGEFNFPNKKAAEIAVETVYRYLDNSNSNIKRVIFNVFKEEDFRIYKDLLR